MTTDPAEARCLLDPLRARLLRELREPESASGLARRLDLPRQKINYHLRELEKHGLVEVVAERRQGNATERRVRAAARGFVLSPAVLGPLAAEAESLPNRRSAAYLLAAASEAVREVGIADPPPAFALRTDLSFASDESRRAFLRELSEAIGRLVDRHSVAEPGAADTRLLLVAHPPPTR